ncbi:MAG: SDR family oxidoreductase [Acidimicrobiales bacterium]
MAVVTGASRGIGAGLATHFAGAGLQLGLCARHAPDVVPGALALAVDVADAGAVDRFAEAVVDRFGRIDLWVNNAGVVEPMGPLAALDPAEVARAIEVNVLGVVNGTATFARHVVGRAGQGVLVNVSSGAATRPYAGWAPYCAAKAAVEQLTECVAIEEADHGLRAYAVAPGLVDTDMQAVIRATDEERFPEVERFRTYSSYNTPPWVAANILDLAFGDQPPEEVRFGVPPEPAAR